MTDKRISPFHAAAIFLIATGYFHLLLFTLLPWMKQTIPMNPAMYWFTTGYFLFIPLFLYALVKSGSEGHKGLKKKLAGLGIRKLSKQEWKYAGGGLLATFVCSGLIFGGYTLSGSLFGTGPLKTTPWFMEMVPFQGIEKLLLLVWLPMFFFNIVGEELLWRGYVQKRLSGRYSWLLCSFLWLVFHLPFGIDLVILLLPIFIIIPYLFQKTGNTMIGILIHGIYNGPIFVAVALGVIR